MERSFLMPERGHEDILGATNFLDLIGRLPKNMPVH